MKTIFRFLGTGVLSATILAVGAVAGFGQDANATPNPVCGDTDAFNEVYGRFLADYDNTKGRDGKAKAWSEKTVTQVRAALAAGKEILEKFGNCEGFKANIDYVKPTVASFETSIIPAKELAPFFKRFDSAIGSDNGDEIYAAGKEILARDSDNINIIVPLGIVGLYQSYNNNNKFADDSIRYAKLALEKLKAGAAATKKNAAGVGVYGALKYELTKEQALDELSYSIAHLTYYGKNDAKAALPLYYEIAQGSGKYKDEPRVYQAIGSYFAKEVLRINAEIAKLIAAQKLLKTDDEKLLMEPKIKEAIGMVYGNADRAMDYYSRAYKLAKSDTPAAKEYKDGLYKNLTILYEGRFNKKDGLDQYIATVTLKPVPNPTTPVTPVNDSEPVTTTGTAAPTTAAPASTAPTSTTAAKPAAKPMSTTVTTKTSVAKTVARKGTRR